jgi:addiction module HigA family antidote
MANTLEPVHPGEVLLEEFLQPLGISQYRLAKDTSVPPRRINEIIHGQRSVTADTALRLAKFFGTSEMFWLNLQARYDLDMEKRSLGTRLGREVVQFTSNRPRRVAARRAAPSKSTTAKRRVSSRRSPR